MSPLSQKLLKGEVQSVTSDLFMAMKWHDRQDVRMLSTLHSDEIVNTGKHDWKTKQPIMKPKCIVDYIRKMGATDQTDMLLCIRKSVKWYKKMALHVLNVALLSALALCLMQNEKDTLLPHYQMSVIRGLLEKYAGRRISSRGGGRSSGGHSSRSDKPLLRRLCA
jgi:hypothetical protein